MEILPEVRPVVNGVHLTLRQIQALSAVSDTGSQNRAARQLGIAVPVLHRYIKELESRLGTELLSSTPRGTVLTREGGEIVDAQKRFENRLRDRNTPAVACSPVFSHLVVKAISQVEKSGYAIDLLIGDDELNTYYLNIGVVDVVIFDDPIYAHRERESYEIFELVEVIKDTLLHVRKTDRYLRFKFGAQRIGFNHLEMSNLDYEIVGETRDETALLESGHSFFLNRSLALRHKIELDTATDHDLLMHSIFALNVGEGEGLDALMSLFKE